ncbi:MAG TPA: glycosyltransferase family 4 protein [Leptolyngbyaceae cyanobacterium]
MKLLIVSKSDIKGGASRAAYRLYQGLNRIGINSQMLVQNKLSDDPSVLSPKTELVKKLMEFRETFEALPVKIYKQRKTNTFWPQWVPDRIKSKVNQIAPDLINLHWISRGYIQIETLANLNKPLVWTFHDMWPFTGGCHYSQDCNLYMQSCGKCPQLQSQNHWDLSRWVWHRKASAWEKLNLTIVTPSKWLAKCAQESSLFKDVRIEVIPYGLDIQKYQPIDRNLARQLLKLPQDKQLILFGAMSATSDRRKGFHLLQPALQSLSKSGWLDRAELVVLGSSGPKNEDNLSFPCHYLGQLSDDISLALVYAAADVFVAPSVEDNLPNTIMEALACGTPCVAFYIGGMPDMIEHQQNGYLAKPYQVEDLAQGIAWVLEDTERHQKLSHNARQKVEQEFALEMQAHRYLSIFTDILQLNRQGQLL